MNTYYAYTRVSTVKQGERGSSLQEQKSAIESYAARNNLQISAWFEEMETAAKQGRRMFNKMLGELRKGRAAGVIIHKIDRSARNLRDWAQLGELIDAGVAVHFAHESVDLLSRGGRLSADIQAVVAADYIRNLRDEVKKGFYGRLKQGLFPLAAPIGYLNNGGGKPKTIDPVKGPLIRKMFELYDSGKFPLHALRAEMRLRGLTASGGNMLSLGSTAHILHNPFYIGLIKLRKTNAVYQGVHEPLISVALFNRVQARLASRAFPHVIRHGFLYRRLITCAECGKSLIGERQKGRAYYRCHSPQCRGTSLREDTVDQEFRALLQSIALTEVDLQDFRDIVAGLKQLAEEAGVKRKAALALDLGRCEDRLSRLTDAFLDGTVDQETYTIKKGELFAERLRLAEQMNLSNDVSPLIELQQKVELGHTAQMLFETQNDEEKRETIKTTTSNFVAYRKKLVITPLFPFSELQKASSLQSGAPTRNRT